MTDAIADEGARLYQAELARQDSALDRFERDVARLVEGIVDYPYLWSWGDGYGGYVKGVITAALFDAGFKPEPRELSSRKKKTISGELRRQVFERDQYRCVTCGGYERLGCDHIVPESKGGPTTFDNLQTMCQSCNSRKGNRVP